jgi:predicted RNA-binding protein (virulence factor B family)
MRQPAVQQRIQQGAKAVLQALLKEGEGVTLNLGDKSSPDDVAAVLGMSKVSVCVREREREQMSKVLY